MFCSQQFSRALEQQVTYCKGLVIIRCITNKPNERWAERAHSGLIFSGYCLGLVQALALGTCFSPRTPCCLIASGHAVCSSAALRSSPQLASLLLDFQYVISPHGQNKNHLKSFMRNS